MSSIPQDVVAALTPIKDPELGFSIIDLGLVYDVTQVGDTADVLMTLTSPACPMQEEFRAMITHALTQLPSINQVNLTFTFSPRWSPEKASDDIQQAFVLLGIPLTRN